MRKCSFLSNVKGYVCYTLRKSVQPFGCQTTGLILAGSVVRSVLNSVGIRNISTSYLKKPYWIRTSSYFFLSSLLIIFLRNKQIFIISFLAAIFKSYLFYLEWLVLQFFVITFMLNYYLIFLLVFSILGTLYSDWH